MGGSRSSSSTSVSTTSIADSYNSTFNAVRNLSDVGNTKLDFGSVDPVDKFPTITALFPFGLLAVAVVVAFMIFRK